MYECRLQIKCYYFVHLYAILDIEEFVFAFTFTVSVSDIRTTDDYRYSGLTTEDNQSSWHHVEGGLSSLVYPWFPPHVRQTSTQRAVVWPSVVQLI
jgi:hypothetical protein